MPLTTLFRQAPRQRFAPRTAIILTCLIAILVLAVDLITPAQYDLGVFYGIATATSVWTGSRKFMWAATSVFVIFVFIVLIVAVIGGPPHAEWFTLAVNRTLTAISLTVIACLVNQWMTNKTAVDAQRTLSRHLLQTLDLAQVTIRKLDGTILFWSQGAERLYGWSADEAVGKVTHTVFAMDLGVEQLADINRQLERDGRWIGELHHTRKDGTPIWVASQWTLHSDGLFRFPIVSEVNNDVTKLKVAESRFRNLTEVLPHLVWQVSASGQTTYANQRWLDYFGRDPSEVTVSTTSTMSQFVHPDDISKSLSRWDLNPAHSGLHRCRQTLC